MQRYTEKKVNPRVLLSGAPESDRVLAAFECPACGGEVSGMRLSQARRADRVSKVPEIVPCRMGYKTFALLRGLDERPPALAERHGSREAIAKTEESL